MWPMQCFYGVSMVFLKYIQEMQNTDTNTYLVTLLIGLKDLFKSLIWTDQSFDFSPIT